MRGLSGICRCGHPREAHEHYRRGSDCGVCGAVRCGGFTAATDDEVSVLRGDTDPDRGDVGSRHGDIDARPDTVVQQPPVVPVT